MILRLLVNYHCFDDHDRIANLDKSVFLGRELRQLRGKLSSNLQA
jgi:hypothetical protein